MNKTLMIAVAFVTALSIAACQSESQGPVALDNTGGLTGATAPDHIVTAGGFVDFPAGNRFTLTLAAKSQDGVDSGQLQMQARSVVIDTAHGVIECLNVQGNTAWVAGVFTSSPDAPDFDGTFFLIGVRDSGVGPGAGPDARTSILIGALALPDCDNPPPFGFTDWESGNVLVK